MFQSLLTGLAVGSLSCIFWPIEPVAVPMQNAQPDNNQTKLSLTEWWYVRELEPCNALHGCKGERGLRDSKHVSEVLEPTCWTAGLPQRHDSRSCLHQLAVVLAFSQQRISSVVGSQRVSAGLESPHALYSKNSWWLTCSGKRGCMGSTHR